MRLEQKQYSTPAPARANLPKKFSPLSDIIAPNEPEAELLTGEKVDSTEGAVRAAKKLLERVVEWS